ncbi:MAG: hypothetical protein V4631_17330 [Pseudomonadota bacterium]
MTSIGHHNTRLLLALLCSLAVVSVAMATYSIVAPAHAAMVASAPAPTPASAAQLVSEVDGSEALTSDVVGALANVMGMSHLVSATRDFCAATLPASVARFSSAAVGWQQRNAIVLAKSTHVLSMSDRSLISSALEGSTARMTDEMMLPVKNGSDAEKIKWCDKAIEAVDSGLLDLRGRASVAPLMNYSLQ